MQASFPVQLFGMDGSGKPFVETAQVLDISNEGARLTISHGLRVGDTVRVKCGEQKGQFRIAWVGETGTPRQGQIVARFRF